MWLQRAEVLAAPLPRPPPPFAARRSAAGHRTAALPPVLTPPSATQPPAMIAAELETLGKLANKALHKKEGAPATASPTARDAAAAGQPAGGRPTSPLAPELR